MRHRCFPKIEMSFWFFLGLSLFLLFDQGNLGSMCVAAVLLHELGHIAAMTLLQEWESFIFLRLTVLWDCSSCVLCPHWMEVRQFFV